MYKGEQSKPSSRTVLFGQNPQTLARIHGNCLEYLAEKRLSEVLTELLHRRIDRLAGPSGNADCKVVLCFLFQQSQNNRLLAIAFSYHCITFPVTNFQPGRCNFRPLIYGCSVCFFALSSAFVTFFPFQSLGKFQRLQYQIACPYFIVQGLGADHFRRQKQLMLACVAYTGIQRPVLLTHLVYDPLSKCAAFTYAVWLVAVCSVRLIYKHSAFCGVAGNTAPLRPVLGRVPRFNSLETVVGEQFKYLAMARLDCSSFFIDSITPRSSLVKCFPACVLLYLWYTGCDP